MLAEILHMIAYTCLSLWMLVLILRFLLQLVKADFYNPISQGLVKITMPILRPMRRVIPGFFGIDLASVVLIILCQVLGTFLQALIMGAPGVITQPILVICWGILGALTIISKVFFWSMVIMIIASFIAPFSHNPIITLANQIINPLAAPLRRLIPPIGGVLDISPIFILLGLQIVDKLIVRMAIGLGLIPDVVVGYWFSIF